MADSNLNYKMSYNEVKNVIAANISRLNERASKNFKEGDFNDAIKCHDFAGQLIRLAADFRYSYVWGESLNQKDEG